MKKMGRAKLKSVWYFLNLVLVEKRHQKNGAKKKVMCLRVKSGAFIRNIYVFTIYVCI